MKKAGLVLMLVLCCALVLIGCGSASSAVYTPYPVAPWIADLSDSDPTVRLEAVKSLARAESVEVQSVVKDPRVVDALIAALADSRSPVRAAVAEALGVAGDPRAVQPLIAAFFDVDPEVQSAASQAIGAMGASAVKPLIAISRKSTLGDSREVDAAKSILSAIRDPSAVEPLIASLKEDFGSPIYEVVVALGAIGDPRAVEPLISVLYFRGIDGKPNTRLANQTVVKALGAIGDPRAVEPLVTILKDDQPGLAGDSAAEALGKIGDPRAVEPLIDVLEHGNFGSRRSAAEALGELGDPRAVEPLSAALKRVDPSVLYSVVGALRSIGNPRAVEALVGALCDSRLASYVETVSAALVEIGAPTVEPLLAAQLRLGADYTPYVPGMISVTMTGRTMRVAVVNTLIRIGEPGSVQPMIDNLNACEDPDLAVLYLNSGNASLAQAAEEWAAARGYEVHELTGASSSGYARWGQK
jgi:HEAT repeat protein